MFERSKLGDNEPEILEVVSRINLGIHTDNVMVYGELAGDIGPI